MEREDSTTPIGLIELASVSSETRGGMGEMIETVGLWHKMGIDKQ